MTVSQAGRIDEELVSIESLAYCLKKSCGYRQIDIEREEDDPPDFWMTISGETFAAEVTSIVTDYDYNALGIRLENAIEQFCRSRNCLKGNYVLKLMGRPEIPRRTSQQWRQLVSDATSYVAKSIQDTRVNQAYLMRDAGGYMAIEKLSNTGATVGLAGPFETKWEGASRSELTKLFQLAVQKKKKALETKGVPDKCSRIILLFYDAYGFCDMDDAIAAFQRVQGFDWLHSVYWAASFTDRPNELFPGTPGRRGCFLYSKKAGWRPQLSHADRRREAAGYRRQH